MSVRGNDEDNDEQHKQMFNLQGMQWNINLNSSNTSLIYTQALFKLILSMPYSGAGGIPIPKNVTSGRTLCG